MLRYAGLLDESARECEAALARDPKSYRWRSCASTYAALGNYERAKAFVDLDPGSEIARRLTQGILVRQGKLDDAVKLPLPNDPFAFWSRECLNRRPPSASSPLPEALRDQILEIRDSEPKYAIASVVAFCGDRESALPILRKAVEGNFCGYPAMDRDPMFAPIRGTAEFAEIRRAGIDCQRRFLAHRAAAKR